MSSMPECPFHEDHEHRIKKNEEKVDALSEHLSKIDKETSVSIAKIATALERLTSLPEAIETMRNSLETNNFNTDLLGKQVNDLSTKIVTLDERISDIDGKDKISIIEWVKKNWFSLVSGAAVLLFLLEKAGLF